VVEILIDSFNDMIRAVPLMFIIFLAVDLLMNRLNKDNALIEKSKKHVYLGGILGVIPQCGISVAFAKLYSSGYITLGMIVAVFISGADEALILLAAQPGHWGVLAKLIIINVLVGIAAGYLVDLLIKEKRNRIKSCPIGCQCPKCKKHKNIFVGTIIHTLKLSLYLLITVFIVNLGVEKLGEDTLNTILGKDTFLQPIYASLIGMIPSCASSVIVTEGYVQGTLSFASLVAGLSANTGYGVLIVLKELPLKKSLKIICIVQAISILVGEIIYFL
jgi:hypothetical protein